ncbi:MAG: hypothetical protein ABFS45_09800 [Pseudomonadota bacterium]
MNRLFILLVFAIPMVSLAGENQSSLVVQTGKWRESDLVVRTLMDLESNKICLTFYVRTIGTSPVISCYDAVSGFRSKINQVGHFKDGKLVLRKLKDHENGVACLVAYVSTPGTSPGVNCYDSKMVAKEAIVRNGHLREGDLDVRRIVDPDSAKTCLVAYVGTIGTSPTLVCYNTQRGGSGGLLQTSYMREGDLIVRKIVDRSNRKACLITYISTEGTSPHLYCFDESSGNQPKVKTEWRNLPQSEWKRPQNTPASHRRHIVDRIDLTVYRGSDRL